MSINDIRPVRVRLDWRAYFEDFSKQHGGNPVEFHGRQLFQDGWQYSLQYYHGPEWSPPSDPRELTYLKISYWRERRRIVREQHYNLQEAIVGLEQLIATRSADIFQRVRVVDDSGTLRSTAERLELDGWKTRIYWLEQDLEYSEKMLTSLKKELVQHEVA